MKLTGETKLFLGLIVVTVVLISGAMIFFAKQENKPALTREELLPAGTQTRGNASASAFLVEFSDFQCPACKAFQPAVEEIITTNGEKLLFAYRHYPLPQHPYSEPAALAAEAAGLQGKFWEMGTELFANQESLSDATVETIVKKLELDPEAFNKAKQDQALKDKIASDKAAGNRFGVNSTPTFFLNGKQLQINSPADLVQKVAAAVQ